MFKFISILKLKIFRKLIDWNIVRADFKLKLVLRRIVFFLKSNPSLSKHFEKSGENFIFKNG